MVKKNKISLSPKVPAKTLQKTKVLSPPEKDLVRRYLIWCYKTTKETLDRVDRYYTQPVVDHFVLDHLKKAGPGGSETAGRSEKYAAMVKDFEKYIGEKKVSADKKKFADESCTELAPDYLYLRHRFEAIEKAISHFLGKKELAQIRRLYEEEMTRRILTAREHT